MTWNMNTKLALVKYQPACWLQVAIATRNRLRKSKDNSGSDSKPAYINKHTFNRQRRQATKRNTPKANVANYFGNGSASLPTILLLRNFRVFPIIAPLSSQLTNSPPKWKHNLMGGYKFTGIYNGRRELPISRAYPSTLQPREILLRFSGHNLLT